MICAAACRNRHRKVKRVSADQKNDSNSRSLIKSEERTKTMIKKEAHNGKPHAGNSCVRFNEGKVASAMSRRGFLLYERMVSAIGVSAFAAVCFAADMTFPLNGGFLDSEVSWGSAIPSSSDTVTLDKPGVYRIAEDITFNRLNVYSGGITNDFAGRRLSFGDNESVLCKGTGLKVFSGGKYSTGNFECHRGVNDEEVHLLFTNGCEVVSTNIFYSARWAYHTTTRITDGSKVYANELRIQNDNGYDNELVVSGGGELHIEKKLCWEVNTGVSGTLGGCNRLKIEGDGSLYRLLSNYSVPVGSAFNDDLFLLADGARAESAKGGVSLGGDNTTNAQLRVENKSMAEFGLITTQSGNLIAVDACATARVSEVEFAGDKNLMKVSNGARADLGGFYILGSGNEILVLDSTLNVTNKGIRTSLATTSDSSNNVLRISGNASSVSISAITKDIFGNGHHNTLSIEDGAKVSFNLTRMMTNTHHSTINVIGSGSKLEAAGIYIGVMNPPAFFESNFTVSNTIYVADGAILDATRIYLMGIDNRLIVSNATVNLTDSRDGIGFITGRKDDDHGNALVLQGKSPKVTSVITSKSSDRFSFAANTKSILRFEIPKEGYEKGHVAIDIKGKFTFGADAMLEIDCDDFVAKTGGRLHLIKAGIIPDESAEVLKKVKLPEGATLEISEGDVYLKSPLKVGFVLSVR